MVSVLFEEKGINSFENFTKAYVEENNSVCVENGWEVIFEENIKPNEEKSVAAKTWNRSITSKMNHKKNGF